MLLGLLLLGLLLLTPRLALLGTTDHGTRNRRVLGLVLTVLLLHIAIDLVVVFVAIPAHLGRCRSGSRTCDSIRSKPWIS